MDIQNTYQKVRPYLRIPVRLIGRMKIKQKCLGLFWNFKRRLDNLLFPLQAGLKNSSRVKRPVRRWKSLYASPVGRLGKPYLAKIIHRFGHENFDYLIFVYDDTTFPESVFKNCQFVYEKGTLCYFFKKYLTPDYCQNYDYIFPWVDDIGIDDFSCTSFLDIFERNELQVAQPALSGISLYSHDITLKNPLPVGRFTDFVEVMVQVFTREAWVKYWELIEPDKNFWGWGYDYLAKSFCGFHRMGIIDCETVTHMCRFTNKGNTGLENHRLMQELFEKYKSCTVSEKKVLGELV